MKNILCYGDSNLRGCIPASFDEKTSLHSRYARDKRWPGILQRKLGKQYHIIEEGLAGRTTNLDELIPNKPPRNGWKDLPLFLESHYPLEIVILSLGTNDIRARFNRTPEQITQAMSQLIELVKNSNKGPSGQAPEILLIAPPIIRQPEIFSASFQLEFPLEAIKNSEKLPIFYQKLSQKQEIGFLDASKIVTSSKLDGVHWEASQHQILAEAILIKIKMISEK